MESHERANSPIRFAGVVLSLAALTGVLIGASMNASEAPGRTRVWPAETRLAPANGAPTLVMVVRPKRSCADPNLTELAAVLARAATVTKSYVVIRRPKALTETWEESESWRRAVAMPGVTVVHDDDDIEARRFEATASGELLLYDADGTLIFHDRITGGPRDIAANAGSATFVSLPSHARAVAASATGCQRTAQGL